jgi:hypothetical protein
MTVTSGTPGSPLLRKPQWATPQLGNHFPDSKDLFGELADSYYRVVQTPKAGTQTR